jgi:hypothetical protein
MTIKGMNGENYNVTGQGQGNSIPSERQQVSHLF